MPSVEYFKLLGLTDNVAEVYGDNTLATAGVSPNGNQALLKSTDAAYENATSMTAGGEVANLLIARGGRRVDGHFSSSGVFNVVARYQDPQGNTIREETVVSNKEGGSFQDFRLKPKSDFIEVAVVDESGTSQTVNGTVHYL